MALSNKVLKTSKGIGITCNLNGSMCFKWITSFDMLLNCVSGQMCLYLFWMATLKGRQKACHHSLLLLGLYTIIHTNNNIHFHTVSPVSPWRHSGCCTWLYTLKKRALERSSHLQPTATWSRCVCLILKVAKNLPLLLYKGVDFSDLFLKPGWFNYSM